MAKNKKKKNEKGFTLIEIMIVIGLIVTLMGIVGPRIIDALKGSNEKIASIQIKSFEQALQTYYLANGFYPHTSQGLQALVQKPSNGRIPENYPEKGYVAKLNKDPWQQEYAYVCDDYQNYTIFSKGPDGQEGTGDDIKSE